MTGAVDFEPAHAGRLTATRVSNVCAFFLIVHHALSVIVGHSDAAPVFSAPKISPTADFVNGRLG
jgi:ABC-type phosphate transport system ATPase subunit